MSARRRSLVALVVVLATARFAAAGTLQFQSELTPPAPRGNSHVGRLTTGCYGSGAVGERSGVETLGTVVVGSLVGSALSAAMREGSGGTSPLTNFAALSALDYFHWILEPAGLPGAFPLTAAPAPSLLTSGSHPPGLWWLDRGGVAGFSALPSKTYLRRSELLGGAPMGDKALIAGASVVSADSEAEPPARTQP